MWKKGDKYRLEYPDYPKVSTREALVNALIHRDYSKIGSEIHIDIYDDRLEIYSPGGMFDGTLIQKQNLYKISSRRRNPVLADLFGRMSLMERRGSGLKKILDNYEMQKNYNINYTPEFYSTHSSFFIILKNLNYNHLTNSDEVATNSDEVEINNTKVATNSDEVATNNIKVEYKQQVEIVLNFAKNKIIFVAKDIEKLLNIKSSRARKILLLMVKDNLLQKLGENKNREYKLNI